MKSKFVLRKSKGFRWFSMSEKEYTVAFKFQAVFESQEILALAAILICAQQRKAISVPKQNAKLQRKF